MTTDPDDLVAWIAELRGRVARGALDGHDDVAVTGGSMPAGVAARIMLADLDHYDDLPPEQREDLLIKARRGLLLRDFHLLREQLRERAQSRYTGRGGGA